MSRCFPFPPPGYEKKIPLDVQNLLDKEKKHKEKRDKKDKKDKKEKEKKKDKKEKRDKKDKKRTHKDKEKSEDKQREKKDPTEELKDNGRHRETEQNNTSVENDKKREREHNKTSVENDTVGPLKFNNFKNLGSNCAQRDDTSEFNFLVDSRKRPRDDDKVKESLLVQKINLTGKRTPEVPGIVPKDQRDIDRKGYGQSKEFVARSHNNCSLASYIGGDERKVECVPGFVDKRTTEQKENGIYKNVDCKKDGHKDPYREKNSKSEVKKGEDTKANVKAPDSEQLNAKENSRNTVCFDNGKPSPLLKAANKTSNLGKRKALEINAVLLHEKESQPNKLPRIYPPSNDVSERGRNSELCTTPTHSVSKVAEKVQNHKANSKFSYNGSKLEATQANIQLVSERQENRDNCKVNNNFLSPHPVIQNNGGPVNMCYASKQYASERLRTSNGHNMDGKISLCRPVVRNGKVVDEAVTHLSNGGDVMIDGQEVNHNDLKINGLVEDKRPNACSSRPSSKKVEKIGGVSAKPPHPDSKYLSQILNFPSVECPDTDVMIDGQKLSNNDLKINGLVEDKKPNVGSTRPSSKKGEKIGRISAKPHPDTKYLSQILNIPSVEWPDTDNQEWLFGESYNGQSNKSTSGTLEETKHVWSKALRIESADITALPYVIPY